MSSTTICILLLLLGACVARILSRRLFSPLRNIPGPERKSLYTGNLTQYHDPDGWEFQRELESNYNEVVKLQGWFGDPQLFIFDPAALHSILVKNQDHYEQMPQFLSMSRLFFGKGIFSTIGEEHRKYRKIMMPAFSTSNLRGMVPLFYEVAEKARDGLISPHVIDGPQTLDLNSIFARVSLEMTGRAGIGHSFDPMLPGEEPTDQYAKSLQALFPAAFKLSMFFPLLPILEKIPLPSLRRRMIDFIPSPALHKLRDLVDFIDAFASELVMNRKARMKSKQLDAKDDARDVMSLLTNNNMNVDGTMYLTDEELVASTSTILSAATDTTSAALSRIFHVLATYPEVQEKLRAEIIATLEHLNHDVLVALPYLDAVLREILRLYPPVSPGMFRETCAETILPLSVPITGTDGKVYNTLSMPKGTAIYIAITAANHNKRIWGEDALEFRPERWTDGKADLTAAKLCGIYGNTMTFLGGGHSCIGFKFAQLEIKVVVCVLLRAFRFSRPDPQIKWRKTDAIPSPSVDGHPKLPILVDRLVV
ncbi:cytochrome P450 [Mycena galopus ATCC 62051]|nr:cytochrome P450 [Mycena galopus ATCC 62051]